MLADVLWIALIALLVIKPEQWPVLARTLGRWARYARHVRRAWQVEYSDLTGKIAQVAEEHKP